MQTLFTPIPKLIKAKQLEEVTLITDGKTGLKYIGQIGDWVINDLLGYNYVLTYHLFISKYMPYNLLAFLMYQKKEQIYKQKGSLMKNIKKHIKEFGE